MKSILELNSILHLNKSKAHLLTTESFTNNKYIDNFLHVNKKLIDIDEGKLAQSLTYQDENDPNYKKFKNKLKAHIINNICCINISDKDEGKYSAAYYNNWKRLASIKILLGKSAYLTALQLTKQLIKEASKFEFTDLILEGYVILRYYSITVDYKYKDFVFYNDQITHYQEQLNLERKAETYYYCLSLLSKQPHTQRNQLILLANQYINELEAVAEKCITYRFHFLFKLTQLIAHMLVYDHSKAIMICDEAIDFFNSKQYDFHLAQDCFQQQKIICCILNNNFNQTHSIIKDLSKDNRKHNINFLNIKQLEFITYIHNKNYHSLIKIIQQVNKITKHKHLSNRIIEKWKINEAFTNLLSLFGKIESPVGSKKPSFKIHKFLNEVSLSSKDKTGSNVAIQIIHMLYLIKNRKYQQVINKAEALRKYNSRHLRDNNQFRSNCFIKMLIKIPEGNFHPVAVERKTQTLYQKLKDRPLAISMQPFDLEIIPYEDLWEMVLEDLKKQN
ncbi:MAG: hypothetical protein AAFO07_16470 [Bacteroidota bacterium]